VKIIIAHAHHDSDHASAIAACLAQRGMIATCQPLESTDSLRVRLEDDIRAAERLVALISPAAVHSTWLRQEIAGGALIELAESRGYHADFVIPVLLRACEVPLLLRDRIGANFAGTSFDDGCQELLAVLEHGDCNGATTNRIFRSWEVNPVGGGKYAVVMEFGVCMRRAQGLHVEVDLGAHYTTTKDWFGPPNRPKVPSRPGGPFFNSSLWRKPPLYERKFLEPDVSPTQSYYLYVEADEPLHAQNRLFCDARGQDI
jgi:hypothetical protein